MADSKPPPEFEAFHWLNQPGEYSFTGTGLSLRTDAKTDFWQRTHYGFQKDDGHGLLKTVSGNFSITANASFRPTAQYDQCGLLARVDGDNWIKCSTEFENAQLSRLGSVVTNLGYSDWASQDLGFPVSSMWYRLSRSGSDFLLEHSDDGEQWRQMRVTRLHRLEETIDVGVYACSPVGEGFDCTFKNIVFGRSLWENDAEKQKQT